MNAPTLAEIRPLPVEEGQRPATDDLVSTRALISQARRQLSEAQMVPDVLRIIAVAGLAEDAARRAGTALELRLRGDVWVRVRYEWSWDPAKPPMAYLALGGRGEELGYEPGPVAFPLPERAELRWPE